MERTERVELTVLCLVHNEDAYLLQDRVKEDWKGYALPGGHMLWSSIFVTLVAKKYH